MRQITYPEFEQVELRVGTITHAETFPQARKPAYKLTIDFGPEIGIKRSSAQITHYYNPEQLIGTQIVAVVNFPPKQIGPFISECLTTGFADNDGNITLTRPEHTVPNGTKLF
ncbi:MAG: tRNA-binding protein [Fimbriimonadaceae bacterium]